MSNLQLNPDKCVLIPLGTPPTPELFTRIREFLVENLPEFANITISSHGKYLGFEIGPGAGELVWKEAASK